MKNFLFVLFLALMACAQLPPLPTTNIVEGGVSPEVMVMAPTTPRWVTLPALTESQRRALEECAEMENVKLGTNRWTWNTYYAYAVVAPTRAHHAQLMQGIMRQAGEVETGEITQEMHRRGLTPEQRKAIRAIIEGK